ncbi:MULTISPECIES: CHASE domain-containing protein [unclassified Mesorhizobium]|jgi:CHASE1-domain containing sensor protein/two-component sensor histidine kinase|uniref:CHASE domain-containing protein n=1 Tax=unclassified Mesorhizobium TaxID=325217 RepID=UPI0008E1C97D|nr:MULTISPECIES: CHASE domain-containing protein [unclassified Mesorhizobium]RJG43774.1 histidine kinase [Mesorhizobium sp. DCY119]SFT46720.1 sensor domain CHASE1-containing protein [Mesorhizobium sp. YR577]
MSNSQARPLKKFLSVAVFLAVAAASLAMAGFAYHSSQEAARFKFAATVDDAMNRIESRLNLHLSLLRSTQALFKVRGREIGRTEFKAFFDALDVENNFKGLRGIGFLEIAKRGDEAQLQQDIRRIGGTEGSIYPPSELEWRTPIVLYEPLSEANISSLGYDMFTEEARRAAIEMAMTSGAPRATARIVLGENTGSAEKVPGFLVFASVDEDEANTGTGGVKPTVSGLVYVAFRTGDLFEAALGSAPLLPVHAEVFDGDASDDNLFYRSPTPPGAAYSEDFRVTRSIVLAGRPWTVRFRPTAGFSEPSSPTIPVMLGLFGLLLAGAIAMVARYQERTYDAVARLHETTEKSLLEKDLMLQEMKHRIKNSITRVLAMARQTAAHATDVNEFSSSFAARLQAMAASQDMLTRSRWQKADLGELLRIELGQVFGKDLPDDMLSGPVVLLNETTTQALGLTFHELATNALKYGEAGNTVAALKVKWRVHEEGGERRLGLTWTESGNKAISPPTRTGFGTKLIDMNITRELYGTIERDYRADGLLVQIDIPLKGLSKTRE